jgi:hypothetical protein
MPLTRAANPPEAETLCVYFWMWDGAEKPVRCCVTTEALRYVGQVASGFTTNEEANEQLFLICQNQIEQAASLKYDRGNIDVDGVLITSSDLGFSASALKSDLKDALDHFLSQATEEARSEYAKP